MTAVLLPRSTAIALNLETSSKIAVLSLMHSHNGLSYSLHAAVSKSQLRLIAMDNHIEEDVFLLTFKVKTRQADSSLFEDENPGR